jgi:hypothetical protein
MPSFLEESISSFAGRAASRLPTIRSLGDIEVLLDCSWRESRMRSSSVTDADRAGAAAVLPATVALVSLKVVSAVDAFPAHV